VAHSPGVSGEHQLEVLKNLTHLLRHTFSSQFVFPVLGHDDPNPGLHFGQGYRDVANHWRHWLPTEAIQTFNKGTKA
jgi:sphingomyelin phosphodiesterase acid-like 3